MSCLRFSSADNREQDSRTACSNQASTTVGMPRITTHHHNSVRHARIGGGGTGRAKLRRDSTHNASTATHL
jgi:hypothetical protein